MIALARLSLRRPVLALCSARAESVPGTTRIDGDRRCEIPKPTSPRATATTIQAAVTGTAAVMVAAAIPFMAGNMLSVRQFGTAIAIAVLLDALIIRPVVLPAAVELMGRRAWWPTQTAGPGAVTPPQPPAVPQVRPSH
ncbi:MAG: MMPL family transporter [Solirubrobacteraceae bacterium]